MPRVPGGHRPSIPRDEVCLLLGGVGQFYFLEFAAVHTGSLHGVKSTRPALQLLRPLPAGC